VSTTTAAIAYLLADRLAGDALYAACAAVNAAGASGPLRLPESGGGVPALIRPQPERLPVGALQLTVSAQAPISRIATANRALSVEVEVAVALEVPLGDGYEIDETALGDARPGRRRRADARGLRLGGRAALRDDQRRDPGRAGRP
jgi:hypothetical protein